MASLRKSWNGACSFFPSRTTGVHVFIASIHDFYRRCLGNLLLDYRSESVYSLAFDLTKPREAFLRGRPDRAPIRAHCRALPRDGRYEA
eukprot:scaffold401564_cov44-Prasinocladus_malaysianus.AAC.1